MPADVTLPYGYFDARYLLLLNCFVGEFVQGGLVFGFNALSVIFKRQGFFSCPESAADRAGGVLSTDCARQESKLAVLWTIGVFALNFGPVIVGGVLDLVGPKLTSMLGTLMTILALVLFGVSKAHVFNALAPGSVILGLAGITYHLSQLHVASLFPRRKGLVASLLVAGFTGCGIVFYILLRIDQHVNPGDLSTRHSYRVMMFTYAGICGIWLPLNFWMMPWRPIQIGQVFLYTGRFHFKVIHRKDLEKQLLAGRRSLHDKTSPAPGSPSAEAYQQSNGFGNDGLLREKQSAGTGGELQLSSYVNLPHSPQHQAAKGKGAYADSSDPRWLEEERSRPTSAMELPAGTPTRFPGTPVRRRNASGDDSPLRGAQENGGGSPAVMRAAGEADAVGEGSSRGVGTADNAAPSMTSLPSRASYWGNGRGDDERDVEGGGANATPLDVVWGPLVFESRRWVELRQQSFKRQMMSAESTGMGIFYTLNVFCIQFYLGTTRLQLEQKGDVNLVVTGIANIVPAFGFLGIPVIGWLLDTKGYGITLGTINFLGVVASLFQAMPSLWFQVVTLIVWCAGRFFLYTSYYAIFGALFGVTNFGRMVAIDNTVNGLFGLLQLPLTSWGLHGLGGNFTAINLLQVVLLLPLFIFAGYMYKWEREDLIPIRPNEGEELPTTMIGTRVNRETKFLKSLERRLSGAGGEASR